jgi:hypothetical protein
VLAEVSDKIPGAGAYLVICAVFLVTVVGAALNRWLWAMLLEFTIIGIGVVMFTKEFWLDANVRQTILREQGSGYFVFALGSALVPIVAGLAVYIYRVKTADQHRRASDAPSEGEHKARGSR